jgi:hypothetical protein
MKKLLYPLILILILTAGCDYLPFGGNEPPVAYIDSISPASAAAGETVVFVGHGTDADGTVVGYKWRSDIDGDLGTLATFNSSALSEGDHTISLTVQDNNGTWSEEVESYIFIGTASAGSIEEGAFEEAESEATSESGTPTTLPYINYLTAEPAVISPGGASIIRWSVSNAEAVTGSYDSTVLVLPVTGSGTVRPTRTTIYTVSATSGASTVSATVTVTVQGTSSASSGEPPFAEDLSIVEESSAAGANLPVINSFAASPQTISAGSSSTLSWNVSNATQLMLISTITKSLSNMIGSTSVSPTTTTTYTLTATNAEGSTNATATVTVQTPTYKTVELPVVSSESGSVNSDHVAGSKLITGDAGTNKTFWAYFSFNISSLGGKEISKAELYFPPDNLNGHPWPDLVSLGIYQVNHGPRALRGSDFTFTGPPVAEGLGQLALMVPIDVTSQVQTAATARAPRFQVRLNFVRMTDNDSKADNISWSNGTLRVKYR